MIPCAAGALSLRPEREDDAAFLFGLFCQSRPGGEDLAGLEPVLRDRLLRQQFAGQVASYRAQYPAARFEIAEWDATPAGRIITCRTPQALLIIDVALSPGARNRGIGSALLRHFMGEAKAAGLPVRLSVFASNPDALRFYSRLGFIVVESSEVPPLLEWREPP